MIYTIVLSVMVQYITLQYMLSMYLLLNWQICTNSVMVQTSIGRHMKQMAMQIHIPIESHASKLQSYTMGASGKVVTFKLTLVAVMDLWHFLKQDQQMDIHRPVTIYANICKKVMQALLMMVAGNMMPYFVTLKCY